METGYNSESLIGHILHPRFHEGTAPRSHEEWAVSRITVESPAFQNFRPIPKKHSSEGNNVSPPLRWSSAPEGTLEWLLICEDPDAPRDTPYIHWILYNIPSETTSLTEGIPHSHILDTPPGAKQGRNSNGQRYYMGPMPPAGHGVHHYYFEIFALDCHLGSVASEDRASLIAKLKDHILGYGELVGTYERK